MDQMPTDEDPFHKMKTMRLYRQITVLRVNPRCGMCGTVRHSTLPVWCLGMRVCKYCMQANLISSKVLFDRYWVDMRRPVPGHESFVNAIAGRVFYFNCNTTAFQRMAYTFDPTDFPGGMRAMYFFWKPHLAKVVDMERLAREAEEKHTAAGLLRSVVRRSLLQRMTRGLKGGPIKRAGRSMLFKMMKTKLLDRADGFSDLRVMARMTNEMTGRLTHWEDKYLPFF
jgi:hypothetical protein